MILEKLPAVQALSVEEKTLLTQELLDELNAPEVSEGQEDAILEVLEARYQQYRKDLSSASSWDAVRDRLREKTGASWRK